MLADYRFECGGIVLAPDCSIAVHGTTRFGGDVDRAGNVIVESSPGRSVVDCPAGVASIVQTATLCLICLVLRSQRYRLELAHGDSMDQEPADAGFESNSDSIRHPRPFVVDNGFVATAWRWRGSASERRWSAVCCML